MTIKGTEEGLLIGDVLLKGKAVVLVLLLEARLPACSGHAGHCARHPCRTLHRQTDNTDQSRPDDGLGTIAQKGHCRINSSSVMHRTHQK